MAEQQGPSIELKLSCFDCIYRDGTREEDQDGSRSCLYACTHPDMPAQERNLGYNTRTPDACPLRAAVIAAALRPIGFVSVEAIEAVLPSSTPMTVIRTTYTIPNPCCARNARRVRKVMGTGGND